MKFSLTAKSFSEAIAATGKIIEPRNTIPILSNVVLKADGDSLHIRATDLDMEISLDVAAQVAEPGTTTVPSRLLSDLLRKLPAGAEAGFTTDDKEQSAILTSGRSRFKLLALPASDYPEITHGQFSHSLEFIGSELADSLSKVSFAISTEETRHYLNGVFWCLDPKHLGSVTFVATDGHRLAKAHREVSGADGMPGIIVPRKTVAEIVGLAKSAGSNPVTVEISQNKIKVTSGTTVLVSKLIDGSFPDYNRVIPELSNMVATVDSKALSSAADRVSTISSERGRAVRLTFKEGSLKLEVNNPDAGSGSDELDIDYGGEPIEIGFNAKYLNDVMAAVGPGNTRITLKDSGSPTIITSEKDDGALYVLMPMRV